MKCHTNLTTATSATSNNTCVLRYEWRNFSNNLPVSDTAVNKTCFTPADFPANAYLKVLYWNTLLT